MFRTSTILILVLLFTGAGTAQIEKEGVAVLKKGDSLKGSFRYEEGSLFTGVSFRNEQGKWVELPADSLRELHLKGRTYRSLLLSKDQAGIRGHVLVLEKVEGKMSMYEGHYRFKSCTCQDLPSIREGAFLLKEGMGRVYLVKKNRWLDRIKNVEDIAPAFLPYDKLMKKVRDREYAFSELEKAVERYNERSKASPRP